MRSVQGEDAGVRKGYTDVPLNRVVKEVLSTGMVEWMWVGGGDTRRGGSGRSEERGVVHREDLRIICSGS